MITKWLSYLESSTPFPFSFIIIIIFFFEFVQFVNHSFLFFIFNLHSNTIFWFTESYIVDKITDSSLIYLKISKYNISSRALQQNKIGMKKIHYNLYLNFV